MKKHLITAAFATLLTSAVSFAATRPVAINNPPAGEASVQQMLNCLNTPGCTNPLTQPTTPIAGAPNAATDQLAAQDFTISPPNSTSSDQTLQFRFSADSNSVFLQQAGNIANKVQIFAGTEAVGSTTLVKWTSQSGGAVTEFAPDGVTIINQFTFSNINKNGFTFAINNGTSTFSAEDAQNGGTARILSYIDGAEIVFTAEDGGDFDYNDVMWSAESIAPVPEPASMALMGAGMLSLAATLRRKLSK